MQLERVRSFRAFVAIYSLCDIVSVRFAARCECYDVRAASAGPAGPAGPAVSAGPACTAGPIGTAGPAGFNGP